MDINKNNYEAWLLDLSEGKLSAGEQQELRAFLLLNPDCAEGTLDMEPWLLESEPLVYSGKDKLRKEIPDQFSGVTEENFDLFSIAMMEGDLTESQEADYHLMLEKDEQKMKDWLHWKQLKLSGNNITYRDKGALKQKTAGRSRVLWLSVSSAAAALLLFFFLFRPAQDITPIAQHPVEQESEEIRQVSEPETASEEGADLIGEPASEPVLKSRQGPKISFKKYQDPPEVKTSTKDQVLDIIKEQDLEERPIKLALLESKLAKPAMPVNYDRIESFDLINDYSEENLKNTRPRFAEGKNISLLSIASAGVDGVRRLTGSDVLLDVSHDEEGEVKGFRFRSSLLSVESPVKKKNISR